MEKIGFIGMGNMGYAILRGIKNVYPPNQIIFHSHTLEKMKHISEEVGIQAQSNNAEVVKKAKYIILAVKPQMFEQIIDEVSEVIDDSKVLISLAPGYTIKQLREMIPNAKIVRTMPNTPALVGEGMTGVCYDEQVLSKTEKMTIQKIFSSIGRMRVIAEEQMDSVVCASGSSPAYVFAFMEALIDSVVSYVLSKDDAYQFVAQTVFGSAKLMMETGKDPKELKEMVCSPGGTTIEGVKALEEYGFDNAIHKATDACYHKCQKICGSFD